MINTVMYCAKHFIISWVPQVCIWNLEWLGSLGCHQLCPDYWYCRSGLGGGGGLGWLSGMSQDWMSCCLAWREMICACFWHLLAAFSDAIHCSFSQWLRISVLEQGAFKRFCNVFGRLADPRSYCALISRFADVLRTNWVFDWCSALFQWFHHPHAILSIHCSTMIIHWCEDLLGFFVL